MTLAYILTVGSELTSGIQENSNSRYIAGRLSELGIACFHLHSTSDEKTAIVHGIKDAFEVADIVIITGGLGPTDDDITREAVAEATGRELILDDEFAQFMTERYRVSDEHHMRQARRPQGSTFITCSIGTAPGIRLESEGKLLFALPGVPDEMHEMFEDSLVPELRLRSPYGMPSVRTYKLCGIGEVEAEQRLNSILPKGVSLGILPHMGEIHLRVTARQEVIEELDERVPELFDVEFFGVDDETLPVAAGRLLREHVTTLATVESCTGGLAAKLITEVPGSSEYFVGGFVCYSDEVKKKPLGVPSQIIEEHGSVSREAALAMAVMGRRMLGSDICVSITGIAGPGGGTPSKPVGLVYTALAWEDGSMCQEHRFSGLREAIRERSAKRALNMVRLRLRGLLP